MVAHEAWRETVNFQCDRRRSLDELCQEFPNVDFQEYYYDNQFLDDDNDNNNNNEDAIWDAYRQRLGDDWTGAMESAELYRVVERGVQGLCDLERRSESQLVVCTHSALLRCLLNWGQDGGVPQQMPQHLDHRSDKTNTKVS